jgi:hypothetical protein
MSTGLNYSRGFICIDSLALGHLGFRVLAIYLVRKSKCLRSPEA